MSIFAPMKIASWNVNSLKVRLPHLLDWLATAQPDVVALQEIKLSDADFPHAQIERAGYRALVSGQKTYNGVALLSRVEACDPMRDIPGFADPQRRVLAASVGELRVIDLYVVNGQEVGSEKFRYKLDWLTALHAWLADEIARHPRLVVLGDFNIAPDDRDVHDVAAWHGQILCSDAERTALRGLYALGLHDSFRLLHEGAGHYSWWDYRQNAFRRNLGLRIDLVLVSEALRESVRGAGIDRAPRALERPSDHAPVWVDLA
ncbi:MAG: Exodeoxyribonuclease III [Xanthomonadales bacterium]|nr:Exodeoxyribonuclease III [Xanthomonadales bacterium]